MIGEKGEPILDFLAMKEDFCRPFRTLWLWVGRYPQGSRPGL